MRIFRLPPGWHRDHSLEDVSRLRRLVFPSWPYFYEPDVVYEGKYLLELAESDGTIVIALDRSRVVGASTALPLLQAHREFREPMADAGHDPAEWYYLAESLLYEQYRGQGIGVRFFEEREAAARENGFAACCFCAVVRDPDDPRRPEGYVPLDGFWRRRGYAPLDGVTATFHWPEVGGTGEVAHTMQFWAKRL